MKINILCMILNMLHILILSNGAIEDPVARHDVSECATYLCPTYRNIAKDYLKSGCVGTFKDYFEINYKEEERHMLEMIKKKNENNNINISTLLSLVSISTLISLYIGFIFSKKEKEKEKENEIKYLMREI